MWTVDACVPQHDCFIDVRWWDGTKRIVFVESSLNRAFSLSRLPFKLISNSSILSLIALFCVRCFALFVCTMNWTITNDSAITTQKGKRTGWFRALLFTRWSTPLFFLFLYFLQTNPREFYFERAVFIARAPSKQRCFSVGIFFVTPLALFTFDYSFFSRLLCFI